MSPYHGKSWYDMTPYDVMPDHIPLFLGNNLLLREHLSLQPVWQQLQGKTYSTIFICNFYYIHLLPKLIVFDCHKYSYNLSSASARGYSVGDKLRKEFPSYWPGFSRYWTGKPEKNRKKYLSIFPASHFCQTLVIVFKFLLQKIQTKKSTFYTVSPNSVKSKCFFQCLCNIQCILNIHLYENL